LDDGSKMDGTGCSCQSRSLIGLATVLVLDFLFLLATFHSGMEMMAEKPPVSSPQYLSGTISWFPPDLDAKR